MIVIINTSRESIPIHLSGARPWGTSGGMTVDMEPAEMESIISVLADARSITFSMRGANPETWTMPLHNARAAMRVWNRCLHAMRVR